MTKVLYDISVLGMGYHQNIARTGIFRVVENLALALLENAEADISFCAYGGVTHTVKSAKYMQHNVAFRALPLLIPGEWGARQALQLMRSVYPNPGEKHLIKAGLSSAIRFAIKQSGILRPGVDEGMLSGQNIFHSTFLPLPDPTVFPPQVKRFITVYDLIPIFHPEFFEGKKYHILHEVVRSIKPDDFVLAISQATKNDLCGYAGIDPAQVFVTPLAAGPAFYRCDNNVKLAAVREKYGIPAAPYILSLSTLEPRKNIAQTIRCFARFVEETGDRNLNLVLVGTKGWDYGGIFSELKANSAVRDRIIVTGYVADDDLAAVYSGALMFVYPSFYEGFGLPPLEAMQCGVPVITSNTSSLPEVVGDAGVMVDPADADALCQAMALLYNDGALRAELGQKAFERAQMFSWQQCAALTFAAYYTALS